MNEPIAFLNGQFLPLRQANISVLDRGFLFSDGVYEVIPVYNGVAFRQEDHIKRLANSLQEIYLPVDPKQFVIIITELIKKNVPQPEQAIYLQVTRGADSIRDYKIPSHLTPNIVSFCMSMPPRNQETLLKGASVITVEDIRWGRCDIKSINLLPNILMRKKAEEAGAEEALFCQEGLVFEGTSTNLFIAKNNTIITSPLGNKVLGGITRQLVLELAQVNGIETKQENISQEMLFEADEIWLTSSTKEVLPVTKVDGCLIKNGLVGPLGLKIMTWYRNFKERLLEET